MSQRIFNQEAAFNEGLGLRSVIPRNIKCQTNSATGEVICTASRAIPMHSVQGFFLQPPVVAVADGVTVYQRPARMNPRQGTSGWFYAVREKGRWAPQNVNFARGQYGMLSL